MGRVKVREGVQYKQPRIQAFFAFYLNEFNLTRQSYNEGPGCKVAV